MSAAGSAVNSPDWNPVEVLLVCGADPDMAHGADPTLFELAASWGDEVIATLRRVIATAQGG